MKTFNEFKPVQYFFSDNSLTGAAVSGILTTWVGKKVNGKRYNVNKERATFPCSPNKVRIE